MVYCVSFQENGGVIQSQFVRANSRHNAEHDFSITFSGKNVKIFKTEKVFFPERYHDLIALQGCIG
jgi:hypothetical protein